MNLRKRAPLAERFWAKVSIAGPDECWNWTACRPAATGYGKFMAGRAPDGSWRPTSAHVMSWMLANNRPVPKGMFVCHACDNRPCVNPRHLFLGTPADNQRDMARKDRSVFGERAPWAKLNEATVAEIWRMQAAGINRAEIARQVGAKYGTVRGVLEGRTWLRSAPVAA